jgi:hypothetical protein
MNHTVCVIILASCCVAAGPSTMPAENTTQLRLVVATVLDTKTPSIRFTALNIGPAAVPEIIFGHRRNWVVVLLPSGAVTQYHMDVDPEIATEQIAPGDTQSWDFGYSELPMISEETRASGEYRLYWQYAGVRSNEIIFVRTKADPLFRPKRLGPLADSQTPADVVCGVCEALDGHVPVNVESGELGSPLAEAVERTLLFRFGAVLQLRSALQQRFGRDADQKFKLESANAALRTVRDARLDFGPYFTTVTVRLDPPIRLVRTDERYWRLAASNFVSDGAVRPEIGVGTELINTATSDVAAGKFASASDAIASIEKQLRERSLRVLDLSSGK